MSSVNMFIGKRMLETANMLKRMGQDRELCEQIESISHMCTEALNNGNKLIFAGNGGSAADSQHLAAEFVSRFAFDRPGLPAIAITTDTSILTAVGNDYGYENLFSRQLQALGSPGDVFFGISTSGRSQNILNALDKARALGIKTVAMTGSAGISGMCDFCISVPNAVTARVQEGHITVGHLLCELIEGNIFQPDEQGG